MKISKMRKQYKKSPKLQNIYTQALDFSTLLWLSRYHYDLVAASMSAKNHFSETESWPAFGQDY